MKIIEIFIVAIFWLAIIIFMVLMVVMGAIMQLVGAFNNFFK
jgi:hypothetical protein